MFGGLKSAPKPGLSAGQAKGKMIRAKINRKRSHSVSHTDSKSRPPARVAFMNDNSKAIEKKDAQISQHKRNTIGPADVVIGSRPGAPLPSLAARSCPELREVPENDAEEQSNPFSGMTEEQISAFRDIFDMFDSNGGGTIRAEDLDQALQSVDIKLRKEEVAEIFDSMDIDGNGEIEFDEFMRLVTNTERFLQTIMMRNKDEGSVPKENVLFNAIAMFMKKSALASVNEIVRYYHTNAQRYSNPHDIIGHYTAGARLIGLTQRQMRRDIKKLTKISSDSKSPYAQPLVTSLDTFFEEQTHSKKLRQKRNKMHQNELERIREDETLHKHARGKIRLKFMACVTSTGPKTRRDSLYLQFLSMQKHINKHIIQGRKKTNSRDGLKLGINSPGVNLPQISKTELIRNKRAANGSGIKNKLAQDLTFDDLELIRKQVSNITTNFYRRMQREKLKEADKHWQDIGSEEIKSDTLRNSLKKAFLAYTDYSQIPVSSIASSYRKTNLACPAI